MTQIIDYSSDEEDTTNHQDFVNTFTLIQNALEVQDYFAKIRAESHVKMNGERQITLKMRSKLLTWLQKLSLTTFKFHRSTFITCILILDQYLEKYDESPASLQILGCAALLIASKLAQETIVDPECYSTASCNIFNKKLLLQKERIIFSEINWKRIRMGPLRAIKIGCNQIHMAEHLQKAEEILALLLKDESIHSWKDSKLIYSVLSFTKMGLNERLQMEDIISLTKQL